MKRKIYGKLAVLFTVFLLFSGCGGNSYSEDTASAKSTMADTGNGWSKQASQEAAAVDTAADTEELGDMTSPEASSSDLTDKDLANRKLIKTVSLSMETKTFDAMKSQLEESVASFSGYIENSDYQVPQGTERYRYYYITVRVPSDRLDAFVEQVGALGTLTNKSENVEDITLDYVDKTAYKESLQVEYDRVTQLLEQAEDLDQILALESKLSQLRYEINSYESQLRTYDNLIDYSTVHINISEVEYEKKASDTISSRISNGFTSSLYAVRDFFVNLFVFLVSNLPILLPLGIVVLLIIFLVKRQVKRHPSGRHISGRGENSQVTDSYTGKRSFSSEAEAKRKEESLNTDKKE